MTDAELLVAWRQGDAAAGNELLQRYFQPLLRFFRHKVQSGVEDLIQHTMLDCVERRDAIEERAGFRGYLFAIARGKLFDHLRREYRRPALDDISEHSLLDLGTSPSSAIARDERRAKIAAALAGIPLDHQIALELAYWEQLSGPEIAAVLGIPANTVRSRLARARQQLRERLGAMGLPLDEPQRPEDQG
ncbi:RNA polymerase sigma factor [Paraliomyxa miuraensis]|uniref:RNA polymerase sigma factor n=1 Tax=Paraliomyxa miuraensis TaxID=376150 RepID=UPI0022511DBD|nr:sigma-70 family RNA polymerase sigma factor [Paraliomyxa miuraensis]MCX4247089.1 sigma-70 family RNA polymerase sigma factor [Paraliomyxa miuraensis]